MNLLLNIDGSVTAPDYGVTWPASHTNCPRYGCNSVMFNCSRRTVTKWTAAGTFTLDDGERVPAIESWNPQRRRGKVTACRFMVLYRGRWRRLFSDRTPGLEWPHFIRVEGKRVNVGNVCP